MNYDVIVIGSGFGGAITACRLAEAGYRVLILERGRRWNKATYPRQEGDAWTWNHKYPEKENGWLDLRAFEHISVAQGAGVGGGSLIYANISCEAPPHVFEVSTWPEEVTYSELKPHYNAVAKFMNVQKIPAGQWTERMKLMKGAAEKIGKGDRFKPLELAVSFDPDWNYGKPDPHNPAHSKGFINQQGVEQGTCVHTGNCDIGCEVYAKNTLDRNYIPWAEKKGAQSGHSILSATLPQSPAAIVFHTTNSKWDGAFPEVKPPASSLLPQGRWAPVNCFYAVAS